MEFRYHTYGTSWASASLELVLIGSSNIQSRPFWEGDTTDSSLWKVARVSLDAQSGALADSRPTIIISSGGPLSNLGFDALHIVQRPCDQHEQDICPAPGV